MFFCIFQIFSNEQVLLYNWRRVKLILNNKNNYYSTIYIVGEGIKESY